MSATGHGDWVASTKMAAMVTCNYPRNLSRRVKITLDDPRSPEFFNVAKTFVTQNFSKNFTGTTNENVSVTGGNFWSTSSARLGCTDTSSTLVTSFINPDAFDLRVVNKIFN